jgi:hypothetical protein
VAARATWLSDALAETLGKVDPVELKNEILRFAPPEALRILAQAKIRDEQVFPTPSVLRARPTLVGYYRLLLGSSQKEFYAGGTGMSPLKRMEVKGLLGIVQEALLNEFCTSMGIVLGELVQQISPSVTPRDVDELRLLTLGSQFQGANNVRIGKTATDDVFLAISELVERFVKERHDRSLTLVNSAKRKVVIQLASDPDICIVESFDTKTHKKVAIEIKGGTDKSNAHNRAGEAEKSHQKAKGDGFRDFWTLIAKRGLDINKLMKESPTTTSWFDVAQVLARTGDDWNEFRNRLAEALGVPVN